MSIRNTDKNSFLRSASVVSLMTAFSRVLGLVREQVMAYFFGAGMATDAFITAFRIPNLLRDMFAEGALSQAFIPVFKGKMVKDGNDNAFKLANIVITAILLFVGIVVLLGIVASPILIYIFANGFVDTPDKFDLTVSLTRVMMIYLLLVSLSAIVMGLLNSFGKFAIPAISPALFNLGVIVTVYGLYHYLEVPVYALAIGVIVGGVGQLVIQVPALYKVGYRYKPVIDFLDEGFKKVIKLLGPMIIGLSASRINILVNTLVASFLIEGAISYLSYSYRLMHFPLGVFAVALGTVALPKVSELVTNNKRDEINKMFVDTLSANMFIVIPSAAFLGMMGHEIVELIFAWGAFSAEDTSRTALALMHYAYGLIGFAAVRVVVPFYYAHSDSKIPMRASVTTVLINLIMYYPMIKLLNFAGLAAATSIAGLSNFLILLYFLPSKGVTYNKGKLWLSIFRIAVASGFAFYIAKMIPFKIYQGDVQLFLRVEALVIPFVIAVVLYLLFTYFLRVDTILKVVHKK